MKPNIDLPGWCSILDKWEEEAQKEITSPSASRGKKGGDLNE